MNIETIKQRIKGIKWTKKKLVGLILLFLLLSMSLIYIIMFIPFGNYDLSPDEDLVPDGTTYAYHAPLDPESPWPKFRANTLQNGRSIVVPQVTDATPWSFRTGKGIFSSPVVDAEGTIYIGSADQIFYAIYKNGSLKWAFATDEIIDSSALLDDQGQVIFGSGDAHVYSLDRETGALNWKFGAHTVEEAEEEYGLELNNVNWFEGNIAMLADGSILAPNDNQILYRLDRNTGKQLEVYLGNEMIWSNPSVNVKTNKIFFGTTNFAITTLFSYDTETGEQEWTAGGLGSMAASSMLTSTKEKGAVLIGGYDGILRAFTQDTGKQLWKVGTNDHIYSSPAQLSDGTIIQASADGTVYAIDTDGEIVWKYDSFEPIRSSPAIDANDVIYVGSGEGALLSINPNGTLRWSYQLILEDRNDLNGSPGLGKEGIYIAGESGEIFYVPYDYPLSSIGRADPRTTLGPGENLPDDGVFLLYTEAFGGLRYTPPDHINLNQPLTFSLFVRKDGDNVLAAIDEDTLEIEVSGSGDYELRIAGDKRFFSIIPMETWAVDSSQDLTVSVKGRYKSDMSRIGLLFYGGDDTGDLDTEFTFGLNPVQISDNPFQAPNLHAGNSSVFELIRPAIPLPTILPSYNQIGFDSLHYLAGVVEAREDSMLLWVIPGKYSEQGTLINPELRERFPLELTYENGLVSFHNYDGFAINFIGAWDMPFLFYRISTVYDLSTNAFINPSSIIAVVNADEIDFYGTGLKLAGISDFSSGDLLATGGITVNTWNDTILTQPIGFGTVEVSKDESGVEINFEGSTLNATEHVFSILLVDSNGNPLSLYYTGNTEITSINGILKKLRLNFDKDEEVKGEITAYFMIDTYPAYSEVLNF
ncbi:MAG: PQQ-like beta-propeller repeat protein [Candidatus Heimdallarchaeota archaeon]|nr:PQQ-like beta-propeller repeat protein [Candidatus Heimdallarchaeota archaeon]